MKQNSEKNIKDLTKEIPAIRRPSLKLEPTPSKEKNVVWDWKTLEEQDNEKKRNPRKKIDEPKTPYLPYTEDDDEYLKKINDINKMQPTKELLEDVCKNLTSKIENKFNNDNDHDHQEDKSNYNNFILFILEKKEFLEKRKQAYKNEFSMAKQLVVEDEEDEDLINETLKNTLYNKFAGKLKDKDFKDKLEKSIK